LKGVTFSYDAQSAPILRNVSLSVEPGQKLAIVGPTGSGKSTLARLILGLYTPTEGEILYDGLPLPSLDYPSLRTQFGVVLQEPFVFSGSIRENIAFDDPNLALERVKYAAQLAELHDDILRLPMGYETLLGEAGGSISGGQRQRLALARAIARSPAVLFLDEATSHLDAATEQRLEHRLTELRCTRIVIAHRLSTVRDADQIVVLDQGQIVECGTHVDLLARRGLYATLIASQVGAPAGAPLQVPGRPAR
jgi:ABC-type bacteriocin/lantibiotic exporter with double-glycine peptidase domain